MKKVHPAEREYYSKLGKRSAIVRRKKLIEQAKEQSKKVEVVRS